MICLSLGIEHNITSWDVSDQIKYKKKLIVFHPYFVGKQKILLGSFKKKKF
jgi:hypothetical protein